MGLALCCAAVLAATGAALAQTPPAPLSPSVDPAGVALDETWEARLQYGIVSRRGALSDAGPGLSYSGLTPNNFALRGWLWFFGLGGLGLSLEREAFALYDGDTRVTGGGLVRAHLGPTARFRLGPARLEALVGYTFHQLPDFGPTKTLPTFQTLSRHGVMLAARGLVDLGPVTIEGRFEYPLALATFNAQGQSTPMSGLTAGGGVRAAVARTGTLVWGAMADASYSTDRSVAGASSAATSSAFQNIIRAGIALDLQWKNEPQVSRSGSVSISVSDEVTSAPLRFATLSVETAGGPFAPALDDRGTALLADVQSGNVTARATLEGYEQKTAEGDVTATGELVLRLVLRRALPALGGLRITVTDKATKAPIAGTTVTAGQLSAVADETGTVVLRALKPGPVSLALTAEGYQPGSEAATVVAGVDSLVELSLVSSKRRELATITGLVRNGRSSAPVKANLAVPEAALRARADDKGAFTFKVVGGTYTVTVSAPGFLNQTKQLVVGDGDQAILNVDLQPQ